MLPPPEMFMATLSNYERLVAARTLAHVAHAGQVDKAGEPYIGHLERVAARAAKEAITSFPSQTLEAIAWLHDVLEDTDVTGEVLRSVGFDDFFIDSLRILTRTQGVPATDYYAGIRRYPGLVIVKLADIADNSAPERLAKLDERTQLRLISKYAKAREALAP